MADRACPRWWTRGRPTCPLPPSCPDAVFRPSPAPSWLLLSSPAPPWPPRLRPRSQLPESSVSFSSLCFASVSHPCQTFLIRVHRRLSAAQFVFSLWNASPGRQSGSLSWLAMSLPSRNPYSAACPSAVKSRSEEHTSELQSLRHLVCRLLLE